MCASLLAAVMDAFYASVEERERPELVGKPLIVGGTPQGRGVVAAANYEVRKYGVHSAMPTATALRLCPHATVIPPRLGYYAEVSEQIRAIFDRYTPLVEPLSLDEAFLDVTDSEPLFGTPISIGREIKCEIRDRLQLTASVGVAPNKFLAKIASDLKKPDGFVVVHEVEVQEFLDPLPVGRLWGVGRVTSHVFDRLGVKTIGDVRNMPRELLLPDNCSTLRRTMSASNVFGCSSSSSGARRSLASSHCLMNGGGIAQTKHDQHQARFMGRLLKKGASIREARGRHGRAQHPAVSLAANAAVIKTSVPRERPYEDGQKEVAPCRQSTPGGCNVNKICPQHANPAVYRRVTWSWTFN